MQGAPHPAPVMTVKTSPHIAKCLLGVKITSTWKLLVYGTYFIIIIISNRTYFKNMCILFIWLHWVLLVARGIFGCHVWDLAPCLTKDRI